ncbi:Uma2 family endonuclease [Streptomyces sp. NPDC006971]|uniref:Uma2 family endonuclease n=1 Tax=Streptomyces sp. NPDC006971 TaxID=3154784 RepID=UPI003400CE5D
MLLPDRAGPWTVDDVLALDEDTSHRVEMVGGALLLTPRPGVAHQRAAHRLAVLLEHAADGFEVLPAVNVNLGGRALAIPDITVVRTAAAAGDRPFVDAADVLLAVEVTTVDTAVTDRITKPVLYAEAGIGHLWRLDLEPAPHLWVGALEGNVYATVARVPAGRSARIPAPLTVVLDPAGLAGPPAR